MKNAEMLTRCHAIAALLDKDERAAFDFSQKHPEHAAALKRQNNPQRKGQ